MNSKMDNMNFDNFSNEQLKQMFTQIMQNAQQTQVQNIYELDGKGHIINNVKNYIACLNTDPLTKGKLKYNEFLARKEFNGGEYTDMVEAKIKLQMSQVLGFDPMSNKFTDAVLNVFDSNRYNPTVDYLNGLNWDGKSRIDTIFIDWLGAEDTPLIREMSRKWLIAAVKRIYEPGCKFDNMIVLKGPQGCGKSTICERLSHGFYNEHINIEDPKYYVETLNRSWIVAFDELAGISRKDLSDIKSFLSKSSETVRLAYAHNPETYKRHCIFIGSTNEDNFLRDYTASIERRFWVIECTRDNTNNIVGSGFTEEIVDQIWAEAKASYQADPQQFLDLSTQGIESLMVEQDKFKTSNTDEILDFVRDMLDKEYVLDNNLEFVDEDDFYNQYCGISVKVGKKSKFARIPTRYVKYVLEKKYRETRSPKYIGSVLKDIIDYKPAKYHGKTDNCYCIKEVARPDRRGKSILKTKDEELSELFNC